jgi:hypothetical protein
MTNESQIQKVSEGNAFPLEEQKIQIDSTFSSAFDQIKGFKSTVFVALLLAVAVYIPIIGLQVGLDYIGNGGFEALENETPKSLFFALLGQLSVWFFGAPLAAGFSILALKRIRGEQISAKEVVSHYNKIIPLFITVVGMYSLMMLGFMLLVIPGIYLSVAYFFATVLVVDKGLSPWQALETSRKAVTKQWFRVFLSIIGVFLFTLVSMIPLGIGLIWTIPWSMLVYAILYQHLFAAE